MFDRIDSIDTIHENYFSFIKFIDSTLKNEIQVEKILDLICLQDECKLLELLRKYRIDYNGSDFRQRETRQQYLSRKLEKRDNDSAFMKNLVSEVNKKLRLTRAAPEKITFIKSKTKDRIYLITSSGNWVFFSDGLVQTRSLVDSYKGIPEYEYDSYREFRLSRFFKSMGDITTARLAEEKHYEEYFDFMNISDLPMYKILKSSTDYFEDVLRKINSVEINRDLLYSKKEDI